jgi:hypothetical protein
MKFKRVQNATEKFQIYINESKNLHILTKTHSQSLLANIQLGRKGLPRKNVLAYLASSSDMKKTVL